MFREIILPIFRSTRLCVTACGIMHPRCLPTTGRQQRGWLSILFIFFYICLYIYILLYFLRLAKRSQFIPPQNVVYFIALPFLVRKILTFYINDVLLYRMSQDELPDFGRVFLMLKYTDITQNTYVQNWTVTEIMARDVWNFDSCNTLIDYQIHIKTGRNMWFL